MIGAPRYTPLPCNCEAAKFDALQPRHAADCAWSKSLVRLAVSTSKFGAAWADCMALDDACCGVWGPRYPLGLWAEVAKQRPSVVWARPGLGYLWQCVCPQELGNTPHLPGLVKLATGIFSAVPYLAVQEWDGLATSLDFAALTDQDPTVEGRIRYLLAIRATVGKDALTAGLIDVVSAEGIRQCGVSWCYPLVLAIDSYHPGAREHRGHTPVRRY